MRIAPEVFKLDEGINVLHNLVASKGGYQSILYQGDGVALTIQDVVQAYPNVHLTHLIEGSKKGQAPWAASHFESLDLPQVCQLLGVPHYHVRGEGRATMSERRCADNLTAAQKKMLPLLIGK